MPLTLYRYILVELVKLMLTATLILTVVLGVGFAIKPLSEGMLGPLSILKIIGYSLPGMLTFALPFAAAMASTLVFLRMSQDNEIIACAAGGLSYRQLLTPIAILGLFMTLGMFWFSNWIVPRSWSLAEREIAQDFMSLTVAQIRRGEVVKLDHGRTFLYADAAQTQPREDIEADANNVNTPFNRIILQGVAVGRIPYEDRLRDAYTAQHAVVDLYRDIQTDQIFARIVLRNVAGHNPSSGTPFFAREVPINPMEIPSPFQQRPKFMSLGRLRELAANPMLNTDVQKARRDLIALLGQQTFRNEIQRQLEADGSSLRLQSEQGQVFNVFAENVSFSADRMQLQLQTDADHILVKQLAGDVTVRTFLAQQATLDLVRITDENPEINLSLHDVTVKDPALPTENSRLNRVVFPLLHMQRATTAEIKNLPLNELMTLASASDLPAAKAAVESLQSRLISLSREILSRLHERSALAVNCLMVLMLGAVMSMWMRDRVPLTVFFCCFAPAAISFLMISSGQELISREESPLWGGIAMAWSGNLGLLFLVTAVLMQLRKN